MCGLFDYRRPGRLGWRRRGGCAWGFNSYFFVCDILELLNKLLFLHNRTRDERDERDERREAREERGRERERERVCVFYLSVGGESE